MSSIYLCLTSIYSIYQGIWVYPSPTAKRNFTSIKYQLSIINISIFLATLVIGNESHEYNQYMYHKFLLNVTFFILFFFSKIEDSFNTILFPFRVHNYYTHILLHYTIFFHTSLRSYSYTTPRTDLYHIPTKLYQHF